MPAKEPLLNSVQYYDGIVENLYFEKGDGEISIYKRLDYEKNHLMMLTVIDISTLFKEKRGKAFDLINKLAGIIHDSLVQIYKWWYIQEELIFVEMEAPSIFYKPDIGGPTSHYTNN
jgi:hypothetical protein